MQQSVLVPHVIDCYFPRVFLVSGVHGICLPRFVNRTQPLDDVFAVLPPLSPSRLVVLPSSRRAVGVGKGVGKGGILGWRD